jgi:hypothetical protein
MDDLREANVDIARTFHQTSSREAGECGFSGFLRFEPGDGVSRHSKVGSERKGPEKQCYRDSQQISGEMSGLDIIVLLNITLLCLFISREQISLGTRKSRRIHVA